MAKQSKQTTAVKEPTIEDLETGLAIDELALEESCARHPDLFYRAAKRLALEQSRRDAAKQALAEAEAAADAHTRHELEVHDEKVTEGKVASAVVLNGAVRAAKEELLSINHRVGQWQALKDAFTQRGYALKSIVDLHLANYFSEVSPNSQRDLRAARAKEAIKENLRRTDREE